MMFATSQFFAAVAGLLFIAPSALALPATPPKLTGCSLANANIPLPANPAPIVAPTGAPSFVSLGFGVQNYTCNAATSTYTATGAVAQLLDLSCAAGLPYFASMSDGISCMAFDLWKKAPASMTIQSIISGQQKAPAFIAPIAASAVSGQHYFVKNPVTGSGTSPFWDFRSSGPTKGNSDAFVAGAKDFNLKAVNNNTDVDLLQLHGIQGKLATSIYRVATKGGQPPTSCTPGSADISVKYVSQYWFYGSTLA